MTYWTGSSAVSASASDAEACAARSDSAGVFIGMDEAGYGPNLGPLLIAATRWQTPSAPQACDFYKLLRAGVAAAADPRGRKLHLADSKIVNQGKHGFRALETSALALLSCLDAPTETFHKLRSFLTSHGSCWETAAPWYEGDLSLPVVACPEQVQLLAQKLLRCMEKSGARLQQIHVDLVAEDRFNDLLLRPQANKGRVLSQLAFQLLRSLWDPAEPGPFLIVGDKHGGRNRYDELLAEVLDGAMIFRVEESQQLSRYRVGQAELRFQVGGEAHLPVACASIIAKYLREVAMQLFNRFWQGHCPHVKPTLGYPRDAHRFRNEVDAHRLSLQIPDHVFWRTV